MESPSIALENVGLSDFLRVIFNAKPENERVFANITETRAPSDSDPRKFWSGRSEAEVERFGKWHAGNTYYCVATVSPDANGVARRAMSHFGGLYVLVLDDVRDLTPFFELDPTYVLETSPGNYQVGFKFTQPIANLAVAKALTKSLSDKGFAGNDPSGNNPVRWVRAPGGKNWKHNPPFTHRLIVWQPDMLFDPENLAAFLGLSLEPIREESKPAAPVTGDSIEEGGRNQALTSMAGSMRRRGMGEESIYAALSVENAAKCIPPLPDADIATIARSVARYEPSDVYRATVGGEVVRHPDGLTIICAADLQPSDEAEILNDELVERTFTKDGFFVLYGESNSGKTFLALDMAAAVERGIQWMGRNTSPCAVLYLASESPQSVQTRLRAYKKRHGAELANFFIIPNPISLFDSEADVAAVIDVVVRLERDRGVKVGLIIGDTLARLSAGANENAGEDMAVVMANCDRIKTAAGAAFGLIHHSGKDAARGMRGWSGMRAHVDTEMEVKADADGNHQAEITKQRDLDGKGDVIGFRLDVLDVGANQWGGKRTTCVVVASEAIQQHEVKGRKPTPSGRIAIAALTEVISDKGKLMPETSSIPKNVKAVTLTEWRDRFYLRYGREEKDESPRKAFARGREDLLAKGLIGISDPYVWSL